MHAWIKDQQKFRIMLSTIGLYIVTITLALLWRHASFAVWFLVPLSILHLFFYGIIHELTHNNIFARVKPNIWIGHMLCPLNLVYFHTFKTIHLQHHRFVQIPEVDPVCTRKKDGTSFNPFWYLITGQCWNNLAGPRASPARAALALAPASAAVQTATASNDFLRIRSSPI